MAVKSEASPLLIALVEQFEKALTLYRERDYQASLMAFKECKKIKEDDEPTKMYIERLEQLCNDSEMARTHDDIVNMTSK